MISTHYQPLCLKTGVECPDGCLDVTAKRSEDGRTVVFSVVNMASDPVATHIRFAGYSPHKDTVTVVTLTGGLDADHRVKLAIDEWGTWHLAGTEVHRTHLFGQCSTLRDALVAALTLDIFNRHADKVIMANIAQLVNNVQSLFLAHEDRFVVTPNFHVFEVYAAHQKGQSVRTAFSAPEIRQGTGSLPGLAGSASLYGKRPVLTVVNPSITQTREAQVLIPGATIREAGVRTLSHTDIRAHNSFENPDVVVQRDGSADAAGTDVVYAFPPASVVRMTADLV